jgi:hypothetical protein
VSPALISHDGRWWWDGTRWRSRLVEGNLDHFWFTTTPDWFERVAITGLIGLIPIVGTINMLGWALVATDMVGQRWRELPPAGFRYLERGVAPFIITFVYGLAALLVVTTLILAGILFLVSTPRHVALAIGIWLLAAILIVAWWLISLYLFAAVLIGSDRLGIGRALDPRRLVTLARRNADVSLQVAVTYGVASLVLGLISVVVGAIVPFGGLAVGLAVPAILAMLAPRLASFRVEA